MPSTIQRTEIVFENVQENNTNVNEDFEEEVSEDAYVKALMGARQPNMLRQQRIRQPPSYLADYIA